MPHSQKWLHFSLTLLIMAIFTTHSHADDKQISRLSLTGIGTIKAAPDMAVISSGVIIQAPTAKQALAKNTQKMQSIFAALTSAGIDKRDMQTSNFNVGPRYKYSKDGTPPRIIGYQVSNQLTLRIRDLKQLGTLLDQMAQVGANRMGNIRFTHSNMTELQDKARSEAVKDAVRKAKIYREGTNTKSVRVLSISENIHSPRPVAMSMERSAKMADRAVPIASGENAIRAHVNIVWEIE